MTFKISSVMHKLINKSFDLKIGSGLGLAAWGSPAVCWDSAAAVLKTKTDLIKFTNLYISKNITIEKSKSFLGV